MGGPHFTSPPMMFSQLTKGEALTKRMRALTCTNEAQTNELYFGIQGLKWGAGEMEPERRESESILRTFLGVS